MSKKTAMALTSLLSVIFMVLVMLIELAAYIENPAPAVVEGNTDFALDLYRELKNTKGNLFFSPYSISTALAMTYAGARENTAKQMADVLHFPPGQKEFHSVFGQLESLLNEVQNQGDVRLNVANSLWPQEGYPFLEEYLSLVKKHYGVVIMPSDYQRAAEKARKNINQWVEEKTRDKIKNIIPPGILNALTRLVLVNAIYFRGNWASQFDDSRTKEDTFYLLSGKTVQTPLMAQEKVFAYGDEEFLQVLELPYVGGSLSMIVFLPKEKDGLLQLEKQLTAANLRMWASGLRKQKVKVFLPRFKMTSQFVLAKTLAAMGMHDAFNPNKANFSGMDGRLHWLYIGAVLHKAFIDVNEEGTEAAAATATLLGRVKMAPQPPIFRVDHPFIFLIRENTTGSILFLGRVMDPGQKGE
jgi:serine protease inhibitor